MSIQENQRAEFMAWLLEVHGLESEWQTERNCFKDYAAHLAFEAWKASLGSVVVKLEKISVTGSFHFFGFIKGWRYGQAITRHLDVKAIKAAGIRCEVAK